MTTFNAKQFQKHLNKGIKKARRRRQRNKEKRNQKRKDVYLFYTQPAYGTPMNEATARSFVEQFYGPYE